MRGPRRSRPRAVLTVLFTDIVGSTGLALRLGDRAWADLIARHHAVVRAALRRHRGRELDTAGDGFFAGFGRPTDALAFAREIVNALRALDLEIRTGIHVGEVERLDDKVGGITVHIAARLMAQAAPGEIVASGTVRDLAAGGGWVFDSLGPLTLKGLPEPVPAFRLDPLSGPAVRDAPAGVRGRGSRPPLTLVAAIVGLVAVATVGLAALPILPRVTGGSSPTSPATASGTASGLGTPTDSAGSVPPSAAPGQIAWSLLTPSGLSNAEVAGIGGVGSGGCCLVVGASGGRAAVWGSADGRTFSTEKAPTDRGARLADAELNGDLPGEATFVIVGADCSAGEDRCVAAAWWTSDPDVGPWTRAGFDVPPAAPSELVGVGVGGPGYITAGTVTVDGRQIGAVWTSADGRRWTRADVADSGPGPAVRDVVGGGGVLLAVGGSVAGAALSTSPDGRTWDTVPTPSDLQRVLLDSVTWADDHFVAVGNGPQGPGMWTSPDGRTWAAVTALPHLAFVSLRGIAATTPNVFALGEGGGSAILVVGCCSR